jgi:hypothetical protein
LFPSANGKRKFAALCCRSSLASVIKLEIFISSMQARASNVTLHVGAESVDVDGIAQFAASMTRVSIGGNSGNVHQPRLSADGTGIVRYSYSTTQVPGDTNGTWDVFYAANPLWVK